MSSSGIPAAPSPPIPGGLLEGWELLRRRTRPRYWLHLGLLLLTLGSTTMVGAGLSHAFYSGQPFRVETDLVALAHALRDPAYVLSGLPFSLTLLAILFAHEMGHYLACVRYGVDASLPYFLPAPTLIGTLGAFIRIRSPIYSKRILFDIGIAGPIAGFLVALPALVLGLAMSTVIRLPPTLPTGTYELGEPLLFKGVTWLIWGTVPDGYSVNMHPVAFAAWFGLLATALNLFPIGQLDGGHISYAVLGSRSSHVTVVTVITAMILSYFSASWVVWTLLTIAMLFLFGRHHPRTWDEEIPLDPTRKWLALFALVLFVLCFSPAPIEIIDVLQP